MTPILACAGLCRVPLSLFVACSALAGFLLSPRASAGAAAVAFASVFLLASGASALNQYQERDIDGKMARTRRRPIPAGDLRPEPALAVSLLLVACGEGLLLLAGMTTAAGLGLFAVLWYNGGYTLLKRKTAFAAVPGALIGMVPPVMGWTAAGEGLLDRPIVVVAAVFFLWQVPHFWLQVLHHGGEYEQAGLPSLTRFLTRRQIARMTFAWICSAAAAAILLPLYGAITSRVLSYALLPLAGWLVIQGTGLLRAQLASIRIRSAFRRLNAYILIIMLLLSAERLVAALP